MSWAAGSGSTVLSAALTRTASPTGGFASRSSDASNACEYPRHLLHDAASARPLAQVPQGVGGGFGGGLDGGIGGGLVLEAPMDQGMLDAFWAGSGSGYQTMLGVAGVCAEQPQQPGLVHYASSLAPPAPYAAGMHGFNSGAFNGGIGQPILGSFSPQLGSLPATPAPPRGAATGWEMRRTASTGEVSRATMAKRAPPHRPRRSHGVRKSRPEDRQSPASLSFSMAAAVAGATPPPPSPDLLSGTGTYATLGYMPQRGPIPEQSGVLEPREIKDIISPLLELSDFDLEAILAESGADIDALHSMYDGIVDADILTLELADLAALLHTV
ncbi:hypothetical protein T492DRAFT_947372 [Pavlovales sp. CCMP2436]|nr:hypothetical protein T492DRAFT_947372 [Pavlovales sp. CCMP2436]